MVPQTVSVAAIFMQLPELPDANNLNVYQLTCAFFLRRGAGLVVSGLWHGCSVTQGSFTKRTI
jgi:hypothetical protein